MLKGKRLNGEKVSRKIKSLNNMEYQEILRFGFGHSLVVPNTPEKVDVSEYLTAKAVKGELEVDSLGFFDSASPNFNTFYPQLTAEDLQPTEDDFVRPTFRALSAGIVRRNSYPVDFSKPGVLKGGAKLLVGQTIYNNHEILIGNQIGAVEKVSWQDAVKLSNGKTIPAGINAVFKIDGKSQPNIARGIMMDPPSIHSCSVTIEFQWEKSHPEMTDSEFYNLWGTYNKDGQLIRKVVTKVVRFYEISLVPHGADPFAKRLDSNGTIVLPDMATSIDQQSLLKKGAAFIDFSTDLENFSEIPTIPEHFNNNLSKKAKMEFIQKLAQSLGLEFNEDTDEVTLQENINTALAGLQDKVKTSEKAVATLTEKNGTLSNTITELEAKLEKAADPDVIQRLTDDIKVVKDKLTAEITRVYKLAKDADPDESFLGLMAKSDISGLNALLSEYTGLADEKFPATCSDCGSHNVSRASAKEDDNPNPPKKKKGYKQYNESMRKASKGKQVNRTRPQS